MKQTKSTIRKQHREIMQSSGNLDLKSYRTHKKLEETLKEAGIERPKQGPKITDPAHIRSQIIS